MALSVHFFTLFFLSTAQCVYIPPSLPSAVFDIAFAPHRSALCLVFAAHSSSSADCRPASLHTQPLCRGTSPPPALQPRDPKLQPDIPDARSRARCVRLTAQHILGLGHFAEWCLQHHCGPNQEGAGNALSDSLRWGWGRCMTRECVITKPSEGIGDGLQTGRVGVVPHLGLPLPPP